MVSFFKKDIINKHYENKVVKNLRLFAKLNRCVSFSNEKIKNYNLSNIQGFSALGGFKDLFHSIGTKDGIDYSLVFRRNLKGAYYLICEVDLKKSLTYMPFYLIPKFQNSLDFSSIMQDNPNHRELPYFNGDGFDKDFKEKFYFYSRPDNFYFITSSINKNFTDLLLIINKDYVYEFNNDKLVVYCMEKELKNSNISDLVINSLRIAKKF